MAGLTPQLPAAAPVDWWARGTAIANIAIALLTIALVVVSWWQGNTAVKALTNEKEKAAKEDEKQKIYRWQTQKVYEILEHGFEKDMKPLSFDDINAAYQREAELQIQRATDAKADEDMVKLKSKDIEPDTLHGILMDLDIDHLIYVLYPGPKYMLEEEVFNPQAPRAVAVANAKVSAFDTLIAEPEHYNIDELVSVVADKNHLDHADCRIAIDELMASGYLRVNDKGQLALKSSLPK